MIGLMAPQARGGRRCLALWRMGLGGVADSLGGPDERGPPAVSGQA